MAESLDPQELDALDLANAKDLGFIEGLADGAKFNPHVDRLVMSRVVPRLVAEVRRLHLQCANVELAYALEIEEGTSAMVATDRDDALGEVEALRSLASEMLGTFTEKGSIGDIDNSLRSHWLRVETVARWREVLDHG